MNATTNEVTLRGGPWDGLAFARPPTNDEILLNGDDFAPGWLAIYAFDIDDDFPGEWAFAGFRHSDFQKGAQ